VEIQLPIDARSKPIDLRARKLEIAPERARARVLVIDDEPALLDALGWILEDFEVTLHTDAREGLRVHLAEAFDVILCDLMMPGFGGLEFHARLTAERPGDEDRIVFMSGGPLPPGVAAACLSKPFGARAVRQLVEERVAALGAATSMTS
jgi:CheY-like chemotaxis protein